MILVFVFVVKCEMFLCRRMAVRLMASGTAAYNVAQYESAIGFSENIFYLRLSRGIEENKHRWDVWMYERIRRARAIEIYQRMRPTVVCWMSLPIHGM
jgi:hypothetical protein